MSSSPALTVSGAIRRAIAGSRSAGMSSTGHTYSATRLASSRFLPRSVCARRMPSRHAARVRSMAGTATTSPSSFSWVVASRTSASATRRSSDGFSLATTWKRYVPAAAGKRVPSKFLSRHRSRRCPVSGCMSRIVRSSASPRSCPDGTSPDAGRGRPLSRSRGANSLTLGCAASTSRNPADSSSPSVGASGQDR